MTPEERRAEIAKLLGRALRRVLEREQGHDGSDATKSGSGVGTSFDGAERQPAELDGDPATTVKK